ncbi:pimeloyl-CoA dehydrogenase [Alicyclobacillus tengchongensis]|nr:pimeloyl-CoA dehydrogenase [Alicyclobacillus tengchongensis]
MTWLKYPGGQRASTMGQEHARVFPTRHTPYIDPFLLLDHFAVEKPYGFPDHPHRGFEILTYVLEGALAHADSAGHESVIPAGGVQHVVAGKGIVHSEMPGTDGIDSGLQLWINLPRSEKGIDPGYEDIMPAALPREQITPGVERTWIVGGLSPVKTRRSMQFEDVAIAAGQTHTLQVPTGYQGFIYVLAGHGYLGEDETPINKGDLLVFMANGDVESLPLTPVRAEDDVRAVFVFGEPVGERPIFNGPFVD